MKTKYAYLISGILFFITFLIPPNIYPVSIFDLSELILIGCFLFNIILFLSLNIENKKIIWQDKRIWSLLLFYLLILFIIKDWDSFILRLIFFTLIGYSIFLILKSSNNILFYEYFIFPSTIIVLLNFILSVFKISFLDNTLGWISYFYEDPNFFQSGRLAGLQGSGPNVAGALFSFLTMIYLSYFFKTNKKFYLICSFSSFYLVFISFSRGSYISLLGCLILYTLLNKFSWKKTIYSLVLLLLSSFGFIFFGNSEIILKESDRSYLTDIALQNIQLFQGLGGGDYVKEIYKNYLLSIDPEILEESLNIELNKVELGITPEEYRDSNINFYIGTSGSGYEILQNSFIVDECEYDRRTCQYQRLTKNTLSKFASILLESPINDSIEYVNNSICLDNSPFVSRGEFACFVKSINSDLFIYDYEIFEYIDIENLDIKDSVSFLKFNYMFPECEESATFGCPNREMALGELAVIIESLIYEKQILPIQNFETFCTECSYQNVYGFIKFEYDKVQGLLPRSVFKFSTSKNGIDWDLVGSQRTTGSILDLNKNSGYIEIGGHSDGQSFGNTFLDASLHSVEITDKDSKSIIIFDENSLNKNYFIFKPNSYDFYNFKITFNKENIKLFRPNKYWVGIENSFEFSDDFEIILELSFPEVPWERQTIISNTSSGTNQHQSWKIDIDDGRFFFQWADGEGSMKDNYVVGDKSLRSGILSQKNGLLTNKSSPIVDPSNLSQLTTAHNGYLTFSVEFGLFWSLLLYVIFMYSIIYIYKNLNQKKSDLIMFLSLTIFLITNLTNDMIYSPDIYLFFMLCLASVYSSISDSEIKKS